MVAWESGSIGWFYWNFKMEGGAFAELGLGRDFCIRVFDKDFDEFCTYDLAFGDISRTNTVVQMVLLP